MLKYDYSRGFQKLEMAAAPIQPKVGIRLIRLFWQSRFDTYQCHNQRVPTLPSSEFTLFAVYETACGGVVGG